MMSINNRMILMLLLNSRFKINNQVIVIVFRLVMMINSRGRNSSGLSISNGVSIQVCTF